MTLSARTLICLLLLVPGIVSGQSVQSDREFEGLKGKVETVMTETTDAKMSKGKIVESKRRAHKFMKFVANGNFAFYHLFHWESGTPFETNTYFDVEGNRVSKVYLGSGALVGSSGEPPTEPKSSKPRDKRYDYKYTYKYDDRGRIVEESMWQNDGELWLRYVYEYSTDERRESVYDKDGVLNQKYLYKLDSKGNEIEMTAYDTKSGRISGKEKYEYLQFDPQDNWTSRIEYEADDNTNFKFQVREKKYRTLTYF